MIGSERCSRAAREKRGCVVFRAMEEKGTRSEVVMSRHQGYELFLGTHLMKAVQTQCLIATYELCQVEIECRVERAHGQFEVFLVDHAGDLDLRRADHHDIDAFSGQHLEHLRRHAGV